MLRDLLSEATRRVASQSAIARSTKQLKASTMFLSSLADVRNHAMNRSPATSSFRACSVIAGSASRSHLFASSTAGIWRPSGSCSLESMSFFHTLTDSRVMLRVTCEASTSARNSNDNSVHSWHSHQTRRPPPWRPCSRLVSWCPPSPALQCRAAAAAQRWTAGAAPLVRSRRPA